MMVSRAASEVISPIPIFQLKPSGLMAGSMAWPIAPAKLCSIAGARPPCVGRWAMIHRTTVTSRITVPARRRKIFERSSSRSPSDCSVGQRYEGISSRNCVRPLFRMEDFRALAVPTAARALKSSILKSGRTQFLLEMPSYRWPTLQSLGLRLLDRSKIFLRRAGTVILLVTVVLWIMAHLPMQGGRAPAIEHSFAGAIGHAIEPAIKPLGFNWKIGIGLITSL